MSLAQGPQVVAIGGGRGLSATLGATRRYAGYTTAVVSTADDSGSTGRLRAGMAVPALGDLRRCLAALAGADDNLLSQAFEYRFNGTDIEGHTLGNLLLAGLTATSGDVLAATEEVARLLGLDPADGRVLPATTEAVDLAATTWSGQVVNGQYAISKTAHIRNITLQPSTVKAPHGVAAAVHKADQVVLGPGSLYTSVLAAALVEELHTALEETCARVVYVCNLIPEHAETLGFDVAAHVDALHDHGIRPDVVLVGEADRLPLGQVRGVEVCVADLAGYDRDTHEANKLACALASLTT